MKCPECSTNHPYSSGMKCSCGYQFILDPKRDGFADGKLLAAVRRASADGVQHFTPNQVVTELYRLENLGCLLVGGVVALLAAGAIFGYSILNRNTDVLGFAAFATFFGTIMIFGYVSSGRTDVTKGLRALNKFEQAKGPFEMKLRNDRPLDDPPPQWKETDIYDYGVEGILFVDREILVDLFVLNQWHSANRMLVVCDTGYPSYIVLHVNRLLDERPDLPLFALHDCDSREDNFIRHLQASTLFELRDKHIQDLSVQKGDLSRTPNLKRFSSDGSVPIDHLRWEKLSSGLTQSIATGVILVDVIGRDPESAMEWGHSYG